MTQTKEVAIIQFRASGLEKEKLENYCKATGRTQTDVLREFIRSLPVLASVA